MTGLADTQDPKTGGWFMIVDKGSQPGNWIDPSGTAMFVYSMQRGIELGLLPREVFDTVVNRGYRSLLTFARINEQGLVDIHGAGDGITIKKDFETYVNVLRIVNAKEAVGGFLWATAIMEKSELSRRTGQ
jgi:unsaturated rhamnogalacturonyl hydrolase